MWRRAEAPSLQPAPSPRRASEEPSDHSALSSRHRGTETALCHALSESLTHGIRERQQRLFYITKF